PQAKPRLFPYTTLFRSAADRKTVHKLVPKEIAKHHCEGETGILKGRQKTGRGTGKGAGHQNLPAAPQNPNQDKKGGIGKAGHHPDRKSTRLNSSHVKIS